MRSAPSSQDRDEPRSNLGHGRRLFGNLVGPDSKRLQDMGSERIDERNIRRVSTSCDHERAEPGDVVARSERPPRALEEHLDPGAEIHWIDHGHADVAEMAVDVARGNVEAAPERNGEMREIAADAD